MKLLITGASGFVGQELARTLIAENHDVVLTSRRKPSLEESPWVECDLTHPKEVERLFEHRRFDCVLHVAGDKDVKRCERDPAHAHEANVSTTQNLILQTNRFETRLVFLSTDFVFEGTRGGYCETDTPKPGTHYGKSKREAELLTLASPNGAVLRTAGVYGRGSPVLTWLLGRLRKNEQTECFTDVSNSPTAILDLARFAQTLAQESTSGIFHCAGPVRMNRFEFFCAVARAYGFSDSLLIPGLVGRKRDELLLLEDSSLSSVRTEARLGVRAQAAEANLKELAAVWSPIE